MKKFNKQQKGSDNESVGHQNTGMENENSGGNKIVTIILGVIAVLLAVQTIQLFLGSGEPAPRPQITGQQNQQNIQADAPPMDFNQQPTGPVTEATFTSMSHDFGTVSANITQRHTFELRNTGDVDLQYTNVYGDPGLNVISWPNTPVPPGGSGQIEVELDPQGETGFVSKIVHIDGNTNPGHVHLTVSANAN